MTTRAIEQLIACANDAAASGEQRRRCLLELFRDHVRPGLPVEELLGWGSVAGWFDARSVFDAGKYSAAPVERQPGESVFMFKPRLPEESATAIYVRLSKPLRLDEFLDVVTGQTRDPALCILQVGLSEPG